MKISNSTRHYRRFEYWRDHTAAGRKYRPSDRIKYNEYGVPVYDKDGDYVWEHVEPKPVSLCPYFWIVTLRAPARMAEDWLRDRPRVAFGLSVLLGVAFLLTLGILAPVPWWQPLAVFAAIIILIVGAFALVGAGFWLSDWNKSRRTTKPSIVTAARQSLAAEFVKSKKQRVCPILEFED